MELLAWVVGWGLEWQETPFRVLEVCTPLKQAAEEHNVPATMTGEVGVEVVADAGVAVGSYDNAVVGNGAEAP